jgi:phosphate/sulfate permease
VLGVLGFALAGREGLARLEHALGSAAPATVLVGAAVAGAALAPEPVAVTLASRVLLVEAAGAPAATVFAVLATLAVALALQSTFPTGLTGLPFSPAQATVGALVGAALAMVGPRLLGLPALAWIALAWVLVPPAAAATARLLAGGTPHEVQWALLLVPASLLLAAPYDPGWRPGIVSLAAGVLSLGASMAAGSRFRLEGQVGQAASAGALGLAAGASDVANVLGPLAAAVRILDQGTAGAVASVPWGLRLLAGGALLLGYAAWRPEDLDDADDRHDGAPVVPLAGGAAAPLALATSLGAPTSTMAALVGAGAALGTGSGDDERFPWRRLAAGTIAWTLLAALGGGFMGGLLAGLLLP